MTATLPDGRHATGPNEETLRCFVPEDFFKLGLTPAQTLTLIKLSTLPHGLLHGRRGWLADQLETSKGRLRDSLRALMARGLIYDHQGSIYIDGERIKHLSETKRAEPDAEAMRKLDGTGEKKNCCRNNGRSGSNSNLNNNNCGDYDKEHTNLSTTCGKIVVEGGQSVGNLSFTPVEINPGGIRLIPQGGSVRSPIDLYREIKRSSIRRGVRGVWQIVGGKLIFVIRAVRRKDRINPDTSILCWFTFKGDMSFIQFRELVLRLTGVIATPYEGLLPASMAGYAISMGMANKSAASSETLRKQLMQVKRQTSQKASKRGDMPCKGFNESEVYRALLSAGFTTAEIENKKRRGGQLIPAVMKFYGRQGWRLGRTAITFDVLTMKLKNVWLPREREKNPLRRYAPAA